MCERATEGPGAATSRRVRPREREDIDEAPKTESDCRSDQEYEEGLDRLPVKAHSQASTSPTWSGSVDSATQSNRTSSSTAVS